MADQADSFEDFYERERDRMFGALCLITANRHEAEEVTQDAFLALWERWERVRGLEDPTGYLYRTAMNAWRKRRRRAVLALRRAVRSSPHAAGGAEGESELMQVLAGLAGRQRAAIVLTAVLGYTSEEAGPMLGVRPVTVRVLAWQARAALREALEVEDA